VASTSSSTCERSPLTSCERSSAASAPWLQQLAHGIDDRPVEPNREAKSASSENTFNRDLTDLDEIRSAVDEMARDVAAWLVRKQRRSRTVTVKVRISGLHDHHPLGDRDPAD
jgi:DNA polymerase-4